VDRGCQWEGTVSSVDDHMIKCEFSRVCCPNKCEGNDTLTGTAIMKKNLQQHLLSDCPKRSTLCSLCGQTGEYQYITTFHSEECDKKVVACSNTSCTEEIERWKLRKHLKECDYTEIRCKYDDLGCSLKRPRRDIVNHEDQEDGIHLATASVLIEDTKTEVQNLNDKICSIKCMRAKALNLGEPLTVKVEWNPFFGSYKKRFYTSPAGYNMSLEIIYCKGSFCDPDERKFVSVYIRLDKGYYDDQLDWPFKKSIKLEILNQNSNYGHFSQVLKFDEGLAINQSLGYHEFISHKKLKNSTNYLNNNAIYFRLTVLYDKPWLICNC